MNWRFVALLTSAGDLHEGDLCWLDQQVCVFDEEHRKYPLPSNITMVIRENEVFIVLNVGHFIRVFHPLLGIGNIISSTKVMRLFTSEFMGQ